MKTIMNSILNIIVILLLLSVTASGSNQDLPDLALLSVEKSHSEIITKSTLTWRINANSETPIENQSIMIEVLEGISKNPHLRSSGNTDFASLKAIVDDLITPEMSDEAKALALWRFVMDNAYAGLWGTSGDAVEHLNVYGYGYCGTFATVLEALWWAAGLKARHVNTGNHAGTEVYYDNDWHYIDAHLRRYFLEKDNRTIASLDDLNDIPELWDMKRQKHKMLQKGEKKYYYMTMHPQDHGRSPIYSNKFTMSKSDMMTLTWQKRGKWCLERGAEGGGKPAPEPAIYANGTFRFRRDFSNFVYSREGLVSSKNIDWDDSAAGYLHPKKTREEAQVVYKVQVPYFITSTAMSGKFLRKNSDDIISMDISTDNGKSWVALWEAVETGLVKAHAITDKLQEVTTDKPWKYSYVIRIKMRATKSVLDVGVYSFESTNDLFYNPKSLPGLQNGGNTLTFQDEERSPRSIKVTYKWEENLPIRISNEFPLEGEKVTIKAFVSNRGKAEAKNILVVFYQGGPRDEGIEIGSDIIRTIAPAETGLAQIQWKATRINPNKKAKTDGARIYAEVDPDNKILELNEANNSYFRKIKVINRPNVRIPTKSFIKIERKKNHPDIISLTATIYNFSGSASYGFYISDHADAEKIFVKFFDDEPKKGHQIGTDQIIDRLKPLEFKNVSVEWDISKLNGQHKIYVQISTPENVKRALGQRKPEEISMTIDLDKYRNCVAGSE